ncbi:MAG: N-acetyltransferase family protein [Candidatus Binataceae bacterium]
MKTIRIREATRADLSQITEIYNYYVIHTPITFDIEPYTPEQRGAWFEEHYAQTFAAAHNVGVVFSWLLSKVDSLT